MSQPARTQKKRREKVAVIGAGRVGKALIRTLREANIEISAIVDKDLFAARHLGICVGAYIATNLVSAIPADTTFVIIAVPDEQITPVAARMAEETALRAGCVVVHTSGALPSEILHSLRAKGALIASMHPIQTFIGDAHDWVRVSGTYFGVEGDTQALARCQGVIARLGGRVIAIPAAHKNLYHLASVFSSNYLIALAALAVNLLNAAGFEERTALEMLTPLMEGTVRNLASRGIAGSISGPIVRGDVGTVQRHCQELRSRFPELQAIYAKLGKIVVSIVQESDTVSADMLSAIRELLDESAL